MASDHIYGTMQKVKFITGIGNFGGSTIALMEHCRLLNARGYDASMYSFEDWCISKYERARRMSELRIEEDDILVFHLLEQSMRPRCKKCFLYLHEKTLWDLNSRVTTGFDSIVFVSESQKRWHSKEGAVIPNPMGGLVDKGLHSPPGENIAGIVGTIQPRKRQHLSIHKAEMDGRSKVLLFGDYDRDYFKSYVEPLLSERVIYKGLYEPERRMDMYNQFDALYVHSSDESASLALGECRILGKEVVKGEGVEDYEIVSDDEIVVRWQSLFDGESEHIDESCVVVSPGGDCEKLVCVVTYNRKELVSKWLRAWHNADKCGAKIAVLHAIDGEHPPKEERDNILAGRPDYYIPFRNTSLRDMQALLLVIGNMAKLPNWKYLFWFTDDLMPMRRDFLKPIDSKIRLPNVGLVAQCFEPRPKDYLGDAVLPHIRTVGYALRREAADELVFPTVGSDRERPYLFEHGRRGFYEDHILNQVLKAGFDFKIAHSDTEVTREVDPSSNYIHWADVMNWMWDCHLFANGTNFGTPMSGEDYWRMYERQFVSDEEIDPLTLFSAKKCEEMTLIPRKVCAIIPTFSSPMNSFMWSVFSLFLRSDPRELEHVVIGINGPDSRDSSPDGCRLQDTKQRFVEEMRGIKEWDRPGTFNPGAITLVRTWSRIGHAQMLEQCINWVHTKYYLSMHDDVIVMDRDWCGAVAEFESDPRLVAKTWGPALLRKTQRVGSTFELPHFNTIFTLCNKPLMRMVDANWIGYHLKDKFRVGDYLDFNKFMELQSRLGSLETSHPELSIKGDQEYDSCSMDIGAFVHSRISASGLRVSQFADSHVLHLEAVSWRNRQAAYQMRPEVEQLEREIMSVPQYADIYQRYKEPLDERTGNLRSDP